MQAKFISVYKTRKIQQHLKISEITKYEFSERQSVMQLLCIIGIKVVKTHPFLKNTCHKQN